MEILTTEDVFDRLEQPGPFQRVRHGIPSGSVLLLGRWALSRCFSQSRHGKEESFHLGWSGILKTAPN